MNWLLSACLGHRLQPARYLSHDCGLATTEAEGAHGKMILGRNDPPDITLQEITFETVRAIISLSVNSEQRRYVALNATSIAEGLLNPGGWIRAIYAGEVPVGFVMLLDPNVPGAKTRNPIDNTSVYLWRLMVDHQFQRRGYAKRALDLVCDRARRVGATRLITSFVPGEHGPERFYLNYGFIATGMTRANGTELELQLVL